MRCHEVRAVLELDDDAAGFDPEALASHLLECTPCAHRDPEVRELVGLPAELPAPPFRRPSPWPRRVAVAAAAVLIAVLFGEVFRHRGAGELATPRATRESVQLPAVVETLRVRAVVDQGRRMMVTESHQHVRAPLPEIVRRFGALEKE